MRFRLGAGILCAAVLLIGGVAVPPRAAAQEPATVDILLDLGDGTYVWSRISIPDRLAPNASWKATLDAAAEHGLRVEWTWFPVLGVGVQDIGDRNPPAGFVGLYVWGQGGDWEFSNTGISDLILNNGDAIAWYNAAFNPWNWSEPARRPVARPGWPTPSVSFRGDAANSGASTSRAPSAARILWERDLGVREIVSTPAVAYGSLFVSTFNGTYALDDATGATRWHNPGVAGFSSPAVVDGTLVVGSSDGSVYRLDAGTGSIRWRARLIPQPGFSGITSSPRVAFDFVYVGTFNESGGAGEVVALWLSNGTVAWRHPTGSVHYSSPAVVNGTLYVGIMGQYNTTTGITFDPPYGVLALDAATGAERWFHEVNGSVAASPLVIGDRVIAPARDGWVYAMDRGTGSQAWRTWADAGTSSPATDGAQVFVGAGTLGGAAGFVTALDPAAGTIRWSLPTNGPVQSAIAYADGKVYAASNTAGGRVYAVNASDGLLLWWHAPHLTDFILATPVVSNGTLFAPSDSGKVTAFRDTADSFAPLEVEAPEAVAQGSSVDVRIRLGPAEGRLSDVSLRATLSPEFQVRFTAPTADRRNGSVLEWDLRPLVYGEEVVILLALSVPSGVFAGRVLHVAAAYTHTDEKGALYAHPEVDRLLEVTGGPGAGPGAEAAILMAVAVAAGVAILLLAIALVWRERRAGR